MTIEEQISRLLGRDKVDLEVPQLPEHGEYSANIAMKMAKELKKNPRELASELIDKLDLSGTYVKKVEVAGGGFINFFASDEWFKSIPARVALEGSKWGSNSHLEGERICLEFVSANPTGPMHMGNARGGALGDSLSRIMEMCGAEVTKEFYLNDAGNQIEKFKLSLEARFNQLKGEKVEFSEDWYQGQDITDHAQAWIDKGNDTPEGLLSYALDQNVSNMKAILEKYNINYDIWFSEKSLYDSGAVDATVKNLDKNGKTYKKDGATWLKTEGDAKDEVLIRENGIPTYYTADIAYHYNKLVERKFTCAINVWGADHGGHIPRMKSGLASLDIDPNRLEVITIQLVRIVREGDIVRMSKRKGDTISLGDLLEEIGPDSARFFFNMRNATSSFDFDLDLAVKQSNDNPVFYVQYAHARICSILELAGIGCQEILSMAAAGINYNYDDSHERALIRRIATFTREIISSANTKEPSCITTYVRNLAGEFHKFYNACKVNTAEDHEVRKARLLLIHAVKQTIRNSLDILGVHAPEKMAKPEEEE